jgi:8-oxo-dGTP diphosphatase
MTNYPSFVVAAFALIFDSSGGVLLCHRTDADLWNLPGGGVEEGESPWQAVVREVLEETGLVVEVDRLEGIYSKPLQGQLVFSFRCHSVGGTLRATDESDRCEYFVVEDLPANTVPKQVERILDAVSDEPRPILRSQTSPSVWESLAEPPPQV